jgi:hypothetical protein
MAITVKHTKVSVIPDDADTSLVRPSDWNADHALTGVIDVANGGTGAATLTGYVKGNGTSAMTAAATVPNTDVTGLGTMSTQNANNVNITGGSITGVSGLGTVTSITAGSGLSGGTITTSGTIALDINSLASTTVVANDLVPVYDVSASANADCLASDIAGLGVGAIGYRNSNYYFPYLMAGGSGTFATTTNQIYYAPFFVRKKTTFTRIGIQVTATGGTIARFGIYNSDNGVPTSLVLDCGTVSTASTGEKEATISQSLNVGFYFLAVVCDGSVTNYTTTNNASASSYSVGQTSRTGQAFGFNTANGSTTLPNPAQTSLTATSTIPAVSLRVV